MPILKNAARVFSAGQEGSAIYRAGTRIWQKAAQGGTVALRTAANPAAAMVINSGHSLTDTLHQGGWPGNIATFRDRDGVRPPYIENADFRTTKATIPGSSTQVRWDHASWPPNGSARRDIGLFDVLTITERGLDNVGVAFPYTLDNSNMAWQVAEDMTYLWRFVDNARRLGRGGAGAETLLWTIWPAIDGSMGPFRPMLDAYEHRWHYRQELINRWLADAGETQFPYMYVIPGHRLLARFYDDIQAGRMPGVTNIQQLFSDMIHPNEAGAYGITCLWYSVVFGRSTVGYPVIADVTSVHPDLGAYFQAVAWDVATTYARAGLGGTDMGAPGLLPAPANVDPAQVSGHGFTLGPISSNGSAGIGPTATPAVPAGPIYGVVAFTINPTQNANEAIMLDLQNAATGASVLSLTYRRDMDRVMLQNDASGGSHAAHLPGLLGEPQVLEFWIDGTGGMLRGIDTQVSFSNGMRPADRAADRYRIGISQWGPFTFNGTLHAVAINSGVPSDADRLRLRAWAHERAGKPFAERQVPARPASI